MENKIYTHLVKWHDQSEVVPLESMVHSTVEEAVRDIGEHFGLRFEWAEFDYITTQVFNLSTGESEEAIDLRSYLNSEHECRGWPYEYAPF